MSNQIVISSGAKVRSLEGILTGSSGVVSSLGINVPSGIPQLDGSGKILVSQLPNSVMEYKGTWNAATNTPTLANGTGNQGDVYLCEVAGTVNFGAGPITFNVGDQVIYSGSIWQRASGATGTVTSVALTESGDSLNITGSPITTSGTINIGFNGNSGQYINGAGNLTTFPSLTGFVPYTGATTNVDLGTYGLLADYLKLNVLPTSIPTTESTMSWNDEDGTMNIKLKGGNVTLQVGQEQVVRVVNKTGASLLEANYQVVRIRSVAEGGAQGQRLAVVLAQGDTAAHSKGVLGLVTETIADNQEGFITILGQVHEIDTTGTLQGETWVDGDKLYLSEITAGRLTKNAPVAPNHSVVMGYVEYAHAVHGKIFVNVNEGISVDELHDVYAPSPADKASIWWNASTLRYENNTVAGILGYTPANAATLISTTAPLSGGGDLSANRTLSITQSGTASNGYLSSTDWNIFNNKQNALGYTPANDTLVVHLAGAETITGIKTFTNEQLFGNGITLQGGYITYTSGIYNLTLNTNLLTANRNVFLKDGSGTLAFTSDIPSLIGYVQGSGTTNYLPKFTGASTIGDSSLYDGGGFGGFNNTGLGVRTFVINAASGRPLVLELIENANVHSMYFRPNNSGYNLMSSNYMSGGVYLPLSLSARETNSDFVLFTDGNLALNTTTNSGYKLDVNGTGRFSGQVNINNASALRLTRFSTESTYYGDIAYTSGGLVLTSVEGYIKIGKGTAASPTTYLSIVDGGAATFSSSVTSTSTIVQSAGEDGSAGPVMRLTSTNSNAGARNWAIINTWDNFGDLTFRVSNAKDGNALSAGTSVMALLRTGNVLIGTTTDAGYKLDVNGTGRFSGNVVLSGSDSRFNGGDSVGRLILSNSNTTTYIGLYGASHATSPYVMSFVANSALALTIASTGAATFSSSCTASAFFESSDKRLKKELIDNPTSVNIENIKPKLYIKNGKEELGYYAQDFLSILPSAVSEGSDGMLSLSYSQVLVAKVSALEQEIKELKAKLN